jgi:hypothetical protein
MSDERVTPAFGEIPPSEDPRENWATNSKQHAEFETQLVDVQNRQRTAERNALERVAHLDVQLDAQSERLIGVLIEEIRAVGARLDTLTKKVDDHTTNGHKEIKVVHDAFMQAKGAGKLGLVVIGVAGSIVGGIAWVVDHWPKIAKLVGPVR